MPATVLIVNPRAGRGRVGRELPRLVQVLTAAGTEPIVLATEYPGHATALARRAATEGADTVVAPCSACYLNLAKADHYMQERPLLGERVNTALAAGGLHYEPGSLKIRHLLDVIIHDIGLEQVKRQVVRPLTGLRVAPYLGCMVPRPDYERRWSDHDDAFDSVP